MPSSKWYEANRERCIAKTRAWEAAHPDRKWARCSIKDHRRQGYIVELTLDELSNMYNHTPRCRYCGKEMCLGIDVSHKLSPTLDRTDNSDTITLYNSQIICRECNTAKGSKTHLEFVLYMREVLQRLDEENA